MTHFLEDPHISSLKVIRFTAITADTTCHEPLGLELGAERLSRVVIRPTRPRGLGGRTQF